MSSSGMCKECNTNPHTKKCEICWEGLCEECYTSKRLYVEWIDEPSKIFRVYRCGIHISSPLRFYDVVSYKPHIPEDYHTL